MTPDVNVLVAAYRVDHPHHAAARKWLDRALDACAQGGRLRLLPMVCTSFVRLVTHPRVFVEPAPPAHALEFVDAMLAVPGCEWVELGREWSLFAGMCGAKSLSANRVQDAWIAAAVRANGAHLVTFDRDFSALLEAHEYTLLGRSG